MGLLVQHLCACMHAHIVIMAKAVKKFNTVLYVEREASTKKVIIEYHSGQQIDEGDARTSTV